MDEGFNITQDGIQVGGWYSNFSEARAALTAFAEAGCSGMRIESCDAGERSEGEWSDGAQEMTSRWSRRMARSA
jgi:hypothetical protein